MSASMDSESGRVVAVDTRGRTWTLDVCTNRWAEQKTAGSPPPGARLVYDPASDLTYAFGESTISTYDVETATWKVVNASAAGALAGAPAGQRFVIDPGTRTVYLYQTRTGELNAYELARNRWAPVAQGQPRPPDGVETLAAFDASVRKIVLELTSSPTEPVYGQTWTFDLASGTWTKVDTPPPAMMHFGYGPYGPEMTYDPAGRRTVVFSDGVLATFEATTGKWTTAPRGPGWPPQVLVMHGRVRLPDGTWQRMDTTTGPLSRVDHGLVDDVVNGRVLVLGGQVRTIGNWRDGSDVWAYRVRTNTWTQIVPAQPTQSTTR